MFAGYYRAVGPCPEKAAMAVVFLLHPHLRRVERRHHSCIHAADKGCVDQHLEMRNAAASLATVESEHLALPEVNVGHALALYKFHFADPDGMKLELVYEPNPDTVVA